MTRLPSESWNTVGLDGPEYPRYKVGPICSMPLCSRPKQETHHITRRSFLGGDYAWVKFTDGAIAGNLIGLDHDCHQLLTENKARIIWDDETRLYEWVDRNGENLGQLSPQPPVHGQPAPKVAVTSHSHIVGPGSAETCLSCGQRIKPDKPDKPEPARRRKTWVVTVPDDAEDGNLVLSTLLEACADLFGHDYSKKNTRYHSLCQALALILQNKEFLVASDTYEAA